MMPEVGRGHGKNYFAAALKGNHYPLKVKVLKLFTYVFMICITIFMLLPFLWMLASSFKPLREIFTHPPVLIGHTFTLDNYKNMFKQFPFGINLWNSFYIASVYTILAVFFCSLGGYAFAKFHPRSGVKDINNVCHVEPLPGLLANVLGIEIEEYEPLGTTVTNTIKLICDNEFINESWAEVIACIGADTLAVHGERYYAGKSALTVNRHGLGKAYYLGCLPENSFYPVFFQKIFSELNIPFEPNIPDGVEIRTRKAEDNTTLYFIYNLTGMTKFLKLNFIGDIKVLLGKEFISGDLPKELDGQEEEFLWELPPYEIVIIKE